MSCLQHFEHAKSSHEQNSLPLKSVWSEAWREGGRMRPERNTSCPFVQVTIWSTVITLGFEGGGDQNQEPREGEGEEAITQMQSQTQFKNM